MKSRPEEVFFVVEVPKDREFADVCKMRYLASACSAISLASKQFACRLDDLFGQ
jgi:hypothetical protein